MTAVVVDADGTVVPDADDLIEFGVSGGSLVGVDNDLKPGQEVKVTVINKEGDPVEFLTTCRIDTPVEIEYYRNGGILHTVLRRMLRGNGNGRP